MRLSVRVQKLVAYLTSAVCLSMAAAAIGWGMLPIDVPVVSVDHSRDVAVAGPGAGPTPLAKADFAQLCDLSLRRPLYDPPPPKPEVRQLPPLGIQLLGTILEGENSIAMVRSEQGQTEYRRLGESVGPVDSAATIVEIQGDAIVLDRQSERLTLRVLSNERR